MMLSDIFARPTLARGGIVLLMICHGLVATSSAQPVPSDEALGDSRRFYWDAEIWGLTNQIAFQDGNDVIWIADLDPVTGRMIPADGRGIRVGAAVPFLSTQVYPFTLNGPEWGISQSGLAVFFSQFDDRGISQLARYRLADGKTVQITRGGSVHRTTALPSQNPQDPETAVLCSYLLGDLLPQLTWRYESEPRINRPIPVARLSSNGPRWIDREFAVVTNVFDSTGIAQVGRFDLSTRRLTPWTTGPGDKINPSVWDAPEFAPGRGLLVEEDGRGLVIYRETLDGWEFSHAIPYPLDPVSGEPANFFDSKPFVFAGRSYIATAVQQPVENPFLTGFSDIYVYDLLGEHRVQLNQTPVGTRNRDPEILLRPDDAWIYYFSLALPNLSSIRLAKGFLQALEPIEVEVDQRTIGTPRRR
jgi:hypothetical protein